MLGVLIAGGTAPAPNLLSDLADADLIVAVDGGLGVARALGVEPTLVVGDLDSALEHDLAWARRIGVEIEEHDRRKDRTDLELALARLTEAGVDRIVVLGTAGGRVDHELGNWAALAAVAATTPASSVEVRSAGGTTWVVTESIEVADPVGTTISLQAWGGPAVVTATGLAWELDRDELSPFEARGVSNEVVTTPARVRVNSGVVLVTRPAQGR